MITNFKIFEDIANKKGYYLVKDDKFFNVRLYKIGMPIEVIKDFNKKFEFKNRENIDVDCLSYYIGCNVDYNNNVVWNYSSTPYLSGRTSQYEFIGYEYMGEVEINEDDILEYEMLINTKKYNL